MKKAFHFSLMKSVSALLLLMLALISPFDMFGKSRSSARQPKNSFETPDFAYPRTVEANAEKVMKDAREKSDYTRMVQALMQLTVARSEVDGSTYAASLDLMEQTASECPAPYSGLVRLLESEMYADIYLSDSYSFNSRQLSPDSVPADVLAWDKRMFADRVSALGEQVFAERPAMEGMPIREIKQLLENYSKETYVFFPTVLDFATFRFAEISREIGLSGTMSAESLLENLAAENRAKGRMEASAWDTVQAIGRENREASLQAAYGEYAGSAACMAVLSQYSVPVSEGERKSVYGVLTAALREYPNSPFAPNVASLVAELEKRSLRTSCPDRVLSGDSIKVELSGTNVNSGYLHLYRVEAPLHKGSLKLKEIVSGGKLVGSFEFSASGSVPFNFSESVEIPNPGYGFYALVPSEDKDPRSVLTSSYSQESVGVVTVSDLSAVFSYMGDSKGSGRLYVVDARNMAPVEGAEVKLYKSDYNKRLESPAVLKTNAEGFVPVEAGGYNILVSSGNDRLCQSVYSYIHEKYGQRADLSAAVLADLSIYHPGDTCRFAMIAYERQGRNFSVQRSQEVWAVLRDVNGKGVASATLATDDFGRAEGSFQIPRSGALGSYSIEISDGPEGKWLGSASFEVADYKAPTFYVEITGTEGEVVPGQDVKVTGLVKTYSGMPVASAKVAYEVEYLSFWRWFLADSGADERNFSGETETDAEGRFEITVPASAGDFAGRPWFGTYVLNATATNAAGESAFSEPMRIAVGEGYRLSADIPAHVAAENGKISFAVRAQDILGKEVGIPVCYRLKRSGDNEILAEGRFDSPRLELSASQLPSACYTIEFLPAAYLESEAPDATWLQESFVLYRPGEKRAPEGCIVWSPEAQIVCAKGQKSVEVPVGSGYADSWVLVGIADSDNLLSRQWVHVSSETLSVRVDAPAAGERRFVFLTGIHNLASERYTVEILPHESQDLFEAKIISFRDNIAPGQREKWTFRFSSALSGAQITPVLAVMTDKALNAIAPFHWGFSPRAHIDWYPYSYNCSVSGAGTSSSRFELTQLPYGAQIFSPSAPEWELWGYSLYTSPVYHGYKLSASRSMGGDGVCCDMAAPMAVSNFAAAESMAAAKGTDEIEEEVAQEREAVRPVAMPLAFFRPDLRTGDDGCVDIDFTVPDFNTTWQLQVLGYTPDMKTSMLTLDAVASKPVMVQANLPRFLRTGDSVELKATLMNNSDEPLEVSGSIEVLNPLTGQVLTRFEAEPQEMAPKSSRVIAASFQVPDNLEMVAVRSFADSRGFRDGEQGAVVILPSSTPVLDTQAFYMNPDQTEVSLSVETPLNASNTLTYCANPIWLCVNALPAITLPDTGASIFSKVRALFGNTVASALCSSYPEIGEAVKYWETHAQQSPLERDDDLKVLALGNTIWVNDAESETLRMAQLSSLLDSERRSSAIADLTAALRESQHSDGGWGWTPEMESSEWVTARVLLNLSMIRMICNGLGAEAPDFSGMTDRAVKFTDQAVYDDYIRNKKEFSPVGMLNYLYVRSYCGKSSSESAVPGFTGLAAKALKAVKEEWKRFDIYETATAATLLWREGSKEEALRILESLRQRSTHTKDQGVCYANLNSGRDGFSRLITTAQALEAFQLDAPTDEIVEGLRQWLILQRQTQNWGGNEYTAELVYALLTSRRSSAALAPASAPEILVNGAPVQLEGMDKYAGEVRLTLPAGSCDIRLKRPASEDPAWGGVISQYIAPIASVKSASVPDLSLSRQVVNISAPGKNSGFRVGDKVRVTLTITSKRDLQYVAVNDLRCAALEPVEQLSQYYCSDGVWMYKEVRNAETNLMIPFLPKGVHVVSYEATVSQDGSFALAPATVQSLYAPAISARTAGTQFTVEVP